MMKTFEKRWILYEIHLFFYMKIVYNGSKQKS